MAVYHPLAREMEAFWASNHDGSEVLAQYQSEFSSRLVTKFAEKMQEHSNNGRFGMSKTAGCTRAAALKFLGHKGEEFTGSTMFTFWLGHMCEVAAISTLECLGHHVDGAQQAVTVDPFMHSYSDGIVTYRGEQMILSVKSTGYKMSGKRSGKYVRQGFAELPFGGVQKVQPSWWSQSQLEMHGSGIHKTLIVAVAKDIVKAFDDDEYLGPKGNGSLTFYVEEIPYSREWCERFAIPAWQHTWDSVQRGEAGTPLYLNKDTLRYVALERANENRMPNAERTGTYSPCAYCDFVAPCKSTQ